MMKGWILLENNVPVITSNNSIEVFKSKRDLFDYYGESLGEMNTIERVEIRR